MGQCSARTSVLVLEKGSPSCRNVHDVSGCPAPCMAKGSSQRRESGRRNKAAPLNWHVCAIDNRQPGPVATIELEAVRPRTREGDCCAQWVGSQWLVKRSHGCEGNTESAMRCLQRRAASTPGTCNASGDGHDRLRTFSWQQRHTHRRGCKLEVGVRGKVLALLLAASMVGLASAQQMCPSSSQICGRCPNECPSCPPVQDNLKCPGASWGNTNSTYMNISCSVLPGMPPENYPNLPIISPTIIRAPLVCRGTIKKGLWPFDADNATFVVETMFRDPSIPKAQANTLYTQCVTFALKVESSGAVDIEGTDEALACSISRQKRDVHDYSGLQVQVCTGVNVQNDPFCFSGRWVTVIDGACIGETVTGGLELVDEGSRLLIRVGGPGELTGCQPRWTLRIERDSGGCVSLYKGHGNCCKHKCVNGERDRSTACRCKCRAGFVGLQCDVTAPHIAVNLTLFNRSRADFWASTSEEIGVQAGNSHTMTSSLARVLGMQFQRIEVGQVLTQEQIGDGAVTDPLPQVKSSTGGRRAAVQDDGVKPWNLNIVPWCEDVSRVATSAYTSKVDLSKSASSAEFQLINTASKLGQLKGAGLINVELRIIHSFEFELPATREYLLFAVSNGTLETMLAEEGMYLCILYSEYKFYNSFGIQMEVRDVKEVNFPFPLSDILLIIFALLGLAVLIFYAWLQRKVELSRDEDAKKHLREYAPVMSMVKAPVGWRVVDPVSREPVHVPPKVNRELEKWYVHKWLQEGEPLFTFELPTQGRWTADFSCMRAYENAAEERLSIVKVADGMNMTLDRSALQIHNFYNNRTIKVVSVPEGGDRRNLNQERTVTAYSSLLRQILVDLPFSPALEAGVEIEVSGKMGATYRDIVTPGLDFIEMQKFALSEQPSRKMRLKYQVWMEESREQTKMRLKNETHFPIESEPPPTTAANILRLIDMQRAAAASAAEKEHQRSGSKHDFGKVDKKTGLTDFTGGDLRDWQASKYTDWKSEVVKIEAFEAQRNREKWGDQTGNIDLHDKRLAEAIFREEIFKPLSSTELLTNSELAKEEPWRRALKEKEEQAVLQAKKRSEFLRARRKKAVAEEIHDEVAV